MSNYTDSVFSTYQEVACCSLDGDCWLRTGVLNGQIDYWTSVAVLKSHCFEKNNININMSSLICANFTVSAFGNSPGGF